MGQPESKNKIEEEFEIHKVQENGNALLRSKKDDKDYLMRIVSCTNQPDLERLKTLLESRAQIKSYHLLSLVEIKQKQQDFICSIHYKMYLVLEYSFKNAAQQIKDRTKDSLPVPFQQNDLWSIVYSCCTGLQALYSNGVSHECLTADQIFISKDGFVKISQPLLFGLQKNHLQAMRTKQSGFVCVHLSPQIMNCLQDQNFFYYEKQKSDIFILAMIVVDLALLQTNFLYDVAKKRPNLDTILGLLKRVGERYTSNFTSVLAEMLRIDSKTRPNLVQIIDRVEKCNNITEEFTLQTQENIKSNQASSQRDHYRVTFEKPAKYKQLQIKQEFLHDSNQKVKPTQERVVRRIPEQSSLSINDQFIGLNPQNFDGRVFNASIQQSYYQPQKMVSFNQKEGSPILTHPSNQPPPSAQIVHLQIVKKPFDLYQSSRSIDSIKIVSNEYSRPEQIKDRAPLPVVKTNPFNQIEGIIPIQNQFKPQQIQFKRNQEPLFTHEIPEVYNIMIKNKRMTPEEQMAFNQQKNITLETGHVSTPQFNGQVSKLNRFTSLKNSRLDTVSKGSDDNEPSFRQNQLKKAIRSSQSETYQRSRFSKYKQLDSYARQAQSPNSFSPNITFVLQPQINPFSGSPPFPLQQSSARPSVGLREYNSPMRSPFIGGSQVTNTFSPSKHQLQRQNQAYTCRSGFNHLPHFPTSQDPNLKLEFVKQQIPQRGRYEGYKCNNQRSGHGILYFKDGGYYQGEWKQDKMHGFGKLYYQNGTIAYEGHWENDQFNGQGRVYNMQPVSFVEDFNYKDFSQLGNRWIYYDGQFKSDSKHGKGYIKLTNGEMYEGVFDHDMIEGNGIFYKRAGEIVIGFWIDNKLFLNQSYQQEKK